MRALLLAAIAVPVPASPTDALHHVVVYQPGGSVLAHYTAHLGGFFDPVFPPLAALLLLTYVST